MFGGNLGPKKVLRLLCGCPSRVKDPLPPIKPSLLPHPRPPAFLPYDHPRGKYKIMKEFQECNTFAWTYTEGVGEWGERGGGGGERRRSGLESDEYLRSAISQARILQGAEGTAGFVFEILFSKWLGRRGRALFSSSPYLLRLYHPPSYLSSNFFF